MSEYKLPDPKTDPLSCLVISYKVAKGFEYDYRPWDKTSWGRAAREAKVLYEIFDDFREAEACLVELSDQFNEKHLDWNLRTIINHAHDWKLKKQGGGNAARNRARLAHARAQQRAKGLGPQNGSFSTPGEILDAGGGLSEISFPQEDHGETRRRGSDEDFLDRILENDQH